MGTKTAQMRQVWRCVGRSGSGCGWVYVSPIDIEDVSHICKDGKRRSLKMTGRRMNAGS